MRNILQYILKILAKMVLWRYRPAIVGVTGSVGKTGTKEAIYRVLKKNFRVRRNIKNYNNEIGVPLTILGQDISPETRLTAVLSWAWIFLKAIRTIVWQRKYPEVLILEMAVRQPGDMKYLIDFVPVKVAVMTAIGQFPVHLEFFPEKGKLVEEKSLIFKSLTKTGLAVLNYDDLSVRAMGDTLSGKTNIVQYGFGQGADIKISNFKLQIVDLVRNDFGINFKLEYQGSIVPVKMKRALGKQQAFAAAAAASIGLFFGLNLVRISSALTKHRSLAGRAKLLKGIKGSWIIDDSYNASPSSSLAALEILEEMPLDNPEAKRIAVLGDMLELGGDTEVGHQQVGQKAASMVDLLFTVGNRARFLAQAAREQGLAKEKVFEFSQTGKAGLSVQRAIKKGDVILIKGSRSMQMEKIVKEIMAQPEKAERLLVG